MLKRTKLAIFRYFQNVPKQNERCSARKQKGILTFNKRNAHKHLKSILRVNQGTSVFTRIRLCLYQ